MRSFSALLLLSIILTLSSCDVSSSDKKPSPIEVQVEPLEAGTANLNGNQLQAKASAGFLFQYWEIDKKNGSLTSQGDKIVTIDKDSIKHVKAVFGANDIEYPFTIRSDAKKGYAYYVTSFIMPVDTAIKRQVFAFVRADLKNQTKKKVYITEKIIHRFDISSDNNFIAFSSYSTGEGSTNDIETFIYGLKTKELSNTHTGGIEPLWANTSNKLLIGSKNSVCISDIYSSQCRNLTIPKTSSTNVNGFKAAAWSPDDKHILLSRDTEPFYLYDAETLERKDIAAETDKSYFFWLDDTSFVTNGTPVDKNNSDGLQYLLQNLSSSTRLSYKANFLPITASPSKKRFAIINNGINIYDSTTDRSKNILNYVEYDPILISWVLDDEILFYGRNQHIVLRMTTDGRVSKL